MNVGDTIELKAKSKHGKDRLHQHGTKWTVKKVGSLCSHPAVFLESLGHTFKVGDQKSKDARWVLADGNDGDFEIMGVV